MKVLNTDLVISGKMIKTASIKSDLYIGWEEYTDVENFINHIINSNSKKFDLFTFSQRIPNFEPKYKYYYEWDNVAAIPIKDFNYWWTKQINDKTRNMARKARKTGVDICEVPFDQSFAEGIKNIYDETPIRQGRYFWHFEKPISEVIQENSSFENRSIFIGAFLGKELIGFIKIVIDKNLAMIMQILSKYEHIKKSPTNALISKAVEICAERKISYLIYSRYIYGKKGEDSLTRFKKHNAFKKFDIPRYWIPITLKGRFAIFSGIHNGISEKLPKNIILKIMDYRNKYLLWKYSKS